MSLPSAALERVADHIVLQPPLSRRGTGPGIVVFLPLQDPLDIATHTTLDPEPVLKWAEEGFAVAAVTISDDIDIMESINKSISALKAHTNVDVKDNFGIIGERLSLQHKIIGAFTNNGSLRQPIFLFHLGGCCGKFAHWSTRRLRSLLVSSFCRHRPPTSHGKYWKTTVSSNRIHHPVFLRCYDASLCTAILYRIRSDKRCSGSQPYPGIPPQGFGWSIL